MKEKEIIQKLEMQRAIFYKCIDTFKEIEFLQRKNIESKAVLELMDAWTDQLHNVQGLMWHYIILELHKLYSKSKKNDKFRICGTVESLIKMHRGSSFKNKVSKDTLVKYQTLLNTDEFNIHFKKLNKIRNDYVAHTAQHTEEISIANNDIIYFLELTQDILTEIIDPITIGGGSIYIGNPSPFRNLIVKMASYGGVYEKVEKALLNPTERKRLSRITVQDLLRILDKKNFIIEGIG